jgi:hypothetical protein
MPRLTSPNLNQSTSLSLDTCLKNVFIRLRRFVIEGSEMAGIPVHKDVMVSKSVLPRLPSDFEVTTLGYKRKGALAQYRGPNAIHVHEYPNHWLFHRDHGDPRTFKGVLAHLLFDAPEIPLTVFSATASGLGVGTIVYEMRKNKSEDAGTEAIIAGAITSIASGALTFLISRKN